MLIIYGRLRTLIVYVAAAAISVALFAGHAYSLTSVGVAASPVASASSENRPLAHHDTAAGKHATRSCCGPLCASGWLLASAPEVKFPLRAAGPAIWTQDRTASELHLVEIFRPP